MGKACSKCKEMKPFEEFHKTRRYKDGRVAQCKVCRKQPKGHRANYYKEYYSKNKDTKKDYARAYYWTHRDFIAEKKAAYYQNNKPYFREARARYRARKLRATPIWVNWEEIKHIYWLCNFISEITGVLHHVDHIHPLQGENICGLHVHTNLQILTAEENLSKGNSLSCSMWLV